MYRLRGLKARDPEVFWQKYKERACIQLEHRGRQAHRENIECSVHTVGEFAAGPEPCNRQLICRSKSPLVKCCRK